MKNIIKIFTLLFLLGTIHLFAQEITTAPGRKLDISAWKLQTINENDNSFLTIHPKELATYTSHFFYFNNDDNSIVFKVPSNGGTTSLNAKYPRVELRQVEDGANWKLTDTTEHYVAAQCKVITVSKKKPRSIIGQIHGSERNSEILKLQWQGYKEGECYIEARFQKDNKERTEYGVKLAEGLSLGDVINYTITMKKGVVVVTVNGHKGIQTYTIDYYGKNDKYYFKAGNYIQWNESIVGSETIYGENRFYKLTLDKTNE